MLRHKEDVSSDLSLVAQPSELGTVLLKSASLFLLGEVFDDALYILDHTTLVAYIPEDYTQFGAEVIRSGENATYFIGHDIWRTADLEASWPSTAAVAPNRAAIYGSAILASLLYPDRVPWFVFPVPLSE